MADVVVPESRWWFRVYVDNDTDKYDDDGSHYERDVDPREK